MAAAIKPVYLAPIAGTPLSVVGDVYRVLAGGDNTGGAFAPVEARVLPGGGPPPHVHTGKDKAFLVFEGELTLQPGNRRVVAEVGVFVPGSRGLPRAFKNESQRPARLLGFIIPAGFENSLTELATPLAFFDSAPVPATAADIELHAAASRHGTAILPGPR